MTSTLAAHCIYPAIFPFIQFKFQFAKRLNYICKVRWKSKYWAFQILGWGLFALLNSYIAYITGEFSVRIVLFNALLSAVGIWLTHRYRIFLIKNRWPEFTTEKLTAYVFIAMSVLSLLYSMLYYVILALLFSTSLSEFSLATHVGSFIAVFILFGFWNAFYFGWNYIENNRMMLIDRLKMESTMKDLEIQTLRSNLQPHFIFNALNSIRALVDEDPEQARAAITSISNILRKSISQKKDTDTIEKEIQFVQDYLALEKIRYEERLQTHFQLEPATLALQIPTMMLQTLVENAIKHGISALEAGGHIWVESKMAEDTLFLQVKNSGHIGTHETHAESLGFGLQATRQRLQWLYGESAQLKLYQQAKEVCVDIFIPLSKITT